jgi:3-oxoacyl-[acyl-carrier-protein] synthase II
MNLLFLLLGIRKLEEKNIVTGAGVSVSASVPRGKSIEEGQYDEEVIFGRLVGKELAEFSQYALYASDLALSHAGLIRGRNGSGAPLSDAKSWELELHVDSERAGVAIASGGIGSLLDIVDTAKNLEKSYKKVSPYFVPKVLTNMPGGQVSISLLWTVVRLQ